MKRVWIYQINKSLQPVESEKIGQRLKEFCQEWNAHGQLLEASAQILHDRFIVFSVDEQVFEASGCSIDSSVRFLKQIESEFKVSLFDRSAMAYLENELVKSCNLKEISSLYANGILKDSTLVFNPAIQFSSNIEEDIMIQFSESGYNRFK
jgi:hypothetical protein